MSDQLTPAAQQAILEFYRTARDLPRSEKAVEYIRKIECGEIIECPVTGRLYESSRVERLQDQIGEVLNLLHPDERKHARGLVPVACIKCRQVVSWLKPGRDRDGFQTRADGSILHIYCCPGCEPEKFHGREVETPLIEKQLFIKHR